MNKIFLLVFLVFSVLLFSYSVSAFTASVTPNSMNVDQVTVLNFTINNTPSNANITYIHITLGSPNIFSFYNGSGSNGTSASNANFSASYQNDLYWTNTTTAGFIENGTTQYFWANVSTDSVPSQGAPILAVNVSYSNGSSSWIDIPVTINFSFSGQVKNSSYQNASGANVSLYEEIMSENGPPTITLRGTTLTNASGYFTLSSLNSSVQNYRLKIILNESDGNATEVSPNLPPFPSHMYYYSSQAQGQGPPGLNGSTFYLQPAATIRLTAVNATGTSINFGYEVIDQVLGFPIDSNVQGNVSTANVVVPRNRNYTIMFARSPYAFPELPANGCWDSGIVIQNYNCPSPPMTSTVTNLSLYNETGTRVFTIQKNITYTKYSLTGYINVTGNMAAVNITDIIPKMIPWTTSGGGHFIPSMDAEIQEFNISDENMINFTKGANAGYLAFYNISVIGSASPGITYFVEFYSNNSNGQYFASFRNVSINQSKQLNITLTRLSGAYDASEDINTSKITIGLINSSGSALTNDAHFEVKVRHSSFGTATYIIDDFDTDTGTFKIPVLNDSTVTVMVFSQQYAPKQQKINLSNNETNITLYSFMPQKMNHTSGEAETESFKAVEMRFMVYNSTCNVPNPSTSACDINRGNATNASTFNPMQAMMAGKSNLYMKVTTTNVTLYFINVDLMASGPPDAQMSENRSSQTGSASSTSFEQAWKFGSLAPNIYDYVLIGIPYSTSDINESWGYNISIPVLYDEYWTAIWNLTAGQNTSTLTSNYPEYEDYTSSAYDDYLTTTGMECTTTSTNTCYWNKTNKYIWIKIPHFSGIQPTVKGTAPASEEEDDDAGGAGDGTGATTNQTANQTTNATANATASIINNILVGAEITKELGMGENISFKIVSGATHILKVINLTNTTATIRITSEPIDANFTINETKEFNLDNDTEKEISIKLVNITNSKAKFIIKALSIDSTPVESQQQTAETEKSQESKNIILVLVITLIALIILAVLWIRTARLWKLRKHGWH